MDAVATATASVTRLYPVGEVPPTPTFPYGAYSAMLGGGDDYTLDGGHGIRNGLVSVQTFGRTTDSATDHMEKVIDVLLDAVLTLAGWGTTPLRSALDQPALTRDPDDNGVITVTLPFTFTATKE